MRQEYAIDKIVQYEKDEVDDNVKVVNRKYTNLTYKIRAARGKLTSIQAKLNLHSEKAPKESGEDDKEMKKWMVKQLDLVDQRSDIEKVIAELTKTRDETPYKIKVSEMPKEERYSKTHQESKHLQNCVKMICFRAETALAQLLAPYFARKNDETRSLVKSVIETRIDLMPDETNKKLVVKLYPLSNRRSMDAVGQILEKVNATKTIYPGTDLVLFYEFATK